MDLFASPEQLVVILFLGCMAAIVIGSILLVAIVSRSARNPKIENAILGQATVLKIWETGLIINRQPQVGFLLNVQHPDGSSYEAQTKAVISIIHLPQIQPGSTLPVKIDAKDRTRVALA